MKLTPVLALAAVATLSFSSLASAKDCTRPAAKPAIPDGKTVSDEDMKAAQNKVIAYLTAMNAYIRCDADDLKSAQDEAKSVSAQFQAQQDIFVKTPAKPQ